MSPVDEDAEVQSFVGEAEDEGISDEYLEKYTGVKESRDTQLEFDQIQGGK